MTAALRTAVKEAVEDLQRLPVWDELNQEEQMNAIGELEGSTGEVPADLAGLKELINQEYTLHNRLSELKESIITLGMQRRADRLRRDRDKNVHTLRIPAKVTTIEKLDELIRELSNLKKALTEHSEIEINIQLED